ncbi:MAG: ankyrin repeat domain-containing protein [Sedimenticola sp.]
MSEYYRQTFATSPKTARELGEIAYRFLLNKLFYARLLERYDVTGIAYFPNASLIIGPTSRPKAVAAQGIDHIFALVGNESHHDSLRTEGIWKNAILAASYTRLDTALITDLWAQLETRFLENLEQAKPWPMSVEYHKRERQIFLNHMLLATLGDKDRMALALSLGADINAATNWFSKTPLMYAAQINDIDATRFLLQKGANPALATARKKYSCQQQLERDHRTVLMYAAENASFELIILLIEAGADVATKDSQDNPASWYLQKNSNLSVFERETLQRRLTFRE